MHQYDRERIDMLAIEYLKWQFPSGMESTGNGSADDFLTRYKNARDQIENLYPKFFPDCGIPD